jgi:tetratricopeptide (TPR) repeat protein
MPAIVTLGLGLWSALPLGAASPSVSRFLNGIETANSLPEPSDSLQSQRFAGARLTEGRSAADYANLADGAFLNANYRQAASLLSRAVRLAPDVSYYRQRLGEAYQRQAESSSFPAPLVRRARRHLQDAVRLDPSNIEALSALVELASLPAGACYGDLGQANRLLDSMERLDPSRAAEARRSLANAVADSHSVESRMRCAPVTLAHELGRQSAQRFRPAEAVIDTGF